MGSVLPSRSSQTRLVRLLSKIAIGLSLTILAVSVLGYGAYRYYNGKLTVISINLPGAHHPAAATAAQNFIIAGSDTRAFAGGSAFQAARGSADFVTGQRSDTVILVHIPAGDAAKADIVSFPRDSYVQIPAYTDKAGQLHPAHMGKLNEAFGDAGAPLLVSMIESLTGLHIDHYVQVDFGGFQKMVDALGGLTLCVGSSRHDHDSGDFLTAGTHPGVRGAQALAFVRDRKGLPNGDIDRIKDQQYFLSQLLKKTLSAGTLTNPFTLNNFLTALTSNVTVDAGFGFDQIRTLATHLRHLDPAHVTFQTIPFTTESGTRTFNGATQSVVLLDPAADAALFNRLRTDATPGAGASASPSASTGALVVSPSHITVAVHNATGTAGLARRTAGQLSAVGFRIGDVGSVAVQPGTVVVYSPDRADSARTLAAAVPGSSLREDPAATAHLELILGAGPVTVQAVSVTGAPVAPPSSPAAAAAPTAAPLTAAAATCAP